MDGRDELLGNRPTLTDDPLKPIRDDIARRLLYLTALFTPFFLLIRLAPVLSGNLSSGAISQLITALLAILVIVVAALKRDQLDGQQIGWTIALLSAFVGLNGVFRLGTNTALVSFIFISLLSLALFVGRRSALVAGVSMWSFAIVMTFYRSREQFADLDQLMNVETGVIGVGSGFGSGILVVIMMSDVLPRLMAAIEQNMLQRSQEVARRTYAEARSQQVEDRWSRYLEYAPVGMALLDDCGRVVAWNRNNERYLGVSPDQMLGERLEDYLLGLDDHHPMVGPLRDLYSNGDSISDYILPLPTEQGIRSVLLQGDPVNDEDGQVIGAFLVGIDVTPLMSDGQREDGVESSRPLLSRQNPLTKLSTQLLEIRSALMAAGVSAETLLTALARPRFDATELLSRATLLAEQQRKASASADAAFALLTDKSDRQRTQEAVKIAETAVNILRNRAADEQIEIELDDAFAEGALVDGQPVLLRQILINLISNAREAIGRSAKATQRRITVNVMAEAESVVFMVEDTAGSVLPVNRDVYFNPTYSSKGQQDDSGKGLYVSRHTAERLGGDLDVEQGEAGLRFVLTLPRCVAPDDQ